jgi:hypothetical protein
MFVRFRKGWSRLNVSLVRTYRQDGKVRSEHVAALGSVPSDDSDRFAVRDRTALWQTLYEVLADVPVADQGRLMAAVHARVPLPTEEERGAAELSDAEHDAEFWQLMHETSLEQIDSCRRLIASTEAKIAAEQELAKQEAEWAEEAKAKAARLANYRGQEPQPEGS